MFNFTVKTYVLTLLSTCLLSLSVGCGWWVAGVITAVTVGYASWTARQRSRAQQREAEARARLGWACTEEVAALVETLSRRAPDLFTPAEQENIRRWSVRVKTAAESLE